MNHDMDTTFVGDEAKLMWQKTHCLVCVSSDRNKAAKLLVENNCDIILSDDGLQRYDFYRDIEISVTADTASDLAAKNDVDGFLVGGASLKPQDFSTIVSAFD